MKLLSRFTILVLILSFLLPLNTLAVNNDLNSENIVILDSGDYYVIEIEYINTRATTVKTAKKHYTYYSSEDVALWKATLTGTFNYNGTTSTCTATSCSAEIYNSSWSLTSKSASRSGNTATGEFVLTLNLLFGASVDIPLTLTLTCDKNGNMS